MPHLYNDYLIGTTRFNEKTASENKNWRDRREWKGCIYGVPKLICRTVPNKIQIIVIEMLNMSPGGKILGFGLITNFTNAEHIAHIYSDKTYNRHNYNSNYRVDIDQISSQYEETIKYLESLLFYGSGHMKRGQGITLFNKKRLNSDWKKKVDTFFRELFVPL
jgi:hypothetical protein